jgi:hypothetical protein
MEPRPLAADFFDSIGQKGEWEERADRVPQCTLFRTQSLQRGSPLVRAATGLMHRSNRALADAS